MPRALTAFVILVLLVAGPALLAREVSPYKVVVNADNPVESLSKSEVSKIFLKKQTKWEQSRRVPRPVDRGTDSPVREVFTTEIHGRKLSRVKSYWMRSIFSGAAEPPPELASDAEVVSFVLSHPDAVGYVSAQTDLGQGVKEVVVTD